MAGNAVHLGCCPCDQEKSHITAIKVSKQNLDLPSVYSFNDLFISLFITIFFISEHVIKTQFGFYNNILFIKI